MQESQSFFAHLPEIVQMILSHLPARDLRRTAVVNRMWRNISLHLLSSRSNWTLHYFEDKELDGEQVQDLLENMSAEPGAVILFSYKEIWLSQRDFQRRRLEERQLTRSVRTLHSRLPGNCVLVGCTTERIIVPLPTDPSPGQTLEHCQTGHAFVCLPHMSGVTFHQVFLSKCRPSSSIPWPEMFDLPQQTPVKLVILFALSASRNFLPNLAAGMWTVYSLLHEAFTHLRTLG